MDENVDVLPESFQGTAKGLVDDLDKDGKNINLNVEYSFLMIGGSAADKASVVDIGDTQYQLLTIGARFLSNTWKVDLSYSSVANVSQNESDYNDISNEQYRYDEGEGELSYFNLYTQPISSKYGEFGFGYYRNISYQILHSKDISVVDIKNDNKNVDNSKKNIILKEDEFVGFNIEINRYYLNYILPDMAYLPDAFGFKYIYEVADYPIIKSKYEMVVHPEVTVHALGFGINKTQDNIRDGFSIKTLNIILSQYNAEYYNYDTVQNEEIKGDRFTYVYEFIYQKTFGKKKFYTKLYFDSTMWDGDAQEQAEVKFTVGLLF